MVGGFAGGVGPVVVVGGGLPGVPEFEGAVFGLESGLAGIVLEGDVDLGFAVEAFDADAFVAVLEPVVKADVAAPAEWARLELGVEHAARVGRPAAPAPS